MDNQNNNNPNSPVPPTEPVTTPPVTNEPTLQPPDPNVEEELQEIEKLKSEQESEELTDAKAIDEREHESQVMEEIEKKDPKLVLTENATPPTDVTTPTEKT